MAAELYRQRDTSILAIESTELSLTQQAVTDLERSRYPLRWVLRPGMGGDGLSHLQVETTKLFRDNLDLSELMAKTFPAEGYLEQVVGFAKDIRILLNAANSPRLRTHFKNPFTIISLAPIGAAAALPSTITG